MSSTTTATVAATTATIQRPMRGSRVASFYPVKSLPSLASLDSAFQIQEYISLLIRHDVHDVDRIVALPERHNVDEKTEDAKADDRDGDRKSELAVDRACWIYEHLRRLAQDLTHPLITMLQQECTRASCREMKAGDWQYLCVAHGNGGAMEQCCAIDYILHTLDSATALLNSPRVFPSRLSIPQTSYRHFASLARRLGRIFAHAYFHHREAFEQAEAESSLYARFLKLTSQFDLVPAEFLVIPESAVSPDPSGHGKDEHVEPPRLAAASVRRDDGEPGGPHSDAHPSAAADHAHGADADHSASVLAPRSPAVRYEKVGTDSPRRVGRSRTDTMIYSEGFAVAEELAKNSGAASPGSATSVLLDRSPAVALPASAATRRQVEDGAWRETGAPEDISELDVPGDADEYGDDDDLDGDDADGEGELEGVVDEIDGAGAGTGSNSPPLDELPIMTLAGPSAGAAENEGGRQSHSHLHSRPLPRPALDVASADERRSEPHDAPSYAEAVADGASTAEEKPSDESIGEPEPEPSAVEETESTAPSNELEVPVEEGDIAPSPAKEKRHIDALEDELSAAQSDPDHPQESDITDEGVHAHDDAQKAETGEAAKQEEEEGAKE